MYKPRALKWSARSTPYQRATVLSRHQLPPTRCHQSCDNDISLESDIPICEQQEIPPGNVAIRREFVMEPPPSQSPVRTPTMYFTSLGRTYEERSAALNTLVDEREDWKRHMSKALQLALRDIRNYTCSETNGIPQWVKNTRQKKIDQQMDYSNHVSVELALSQDPARISVWKTQMWVNWMVNLVQLKVQSCYLLKEIGRRIPQHPTPQTMFKALRRLHGQNLETRGLNDMSEAFQSFVTRARFFSVGKLRRTWSHSAAEFIKYRRLLPMLLADGQRFNSAETDDFDASLAFHAKSKEERKIVVTNVPPRVTPSQLQSFFSKFGKVSHCSLPREDRRHSMFGTMPKHSKNCGTATITFKKAEDAEKAKSAASDELKFYEQYMVVSAYVSKRKGGKGVIIADDSKDEMYDLSRASSNQSLASTTMSSLCYEGCSLDEIGSRPLERIAAYLPVNDTIRFERVSKRCMEASMKSWSLVSRLVLARDCEGFSNSRPFLNSHLKAILRRAGVHLKALDLSGAVHLMDEKALEIIAAYCTMLEELVLSGVRASWEALSDLGESLTNLKKLTYRDMDSASDKAIWYLIKGCGRCLQFVDLRGCRRLHGRCFQLFSDQLEQLYLDGCVHVDERALEDLCTNAFCLKELRINDCFKITDENLSMISRLMPDLRVFTLCGDRFENLTTAGISHISNMSSLVELALDYNLLVDDALLISVCDQLKSLKILSLANAGTDSTLTAKGIVAIARLTALEQLDLSSLAAVRSGILLEIAYSCRSLSLLQLRNCVYLSDEGVRGLALMKQIRHLDLSGSILITNESVQHFIKAFPVDGGEKCPITIVVGGTAVDSGRLTVRGSRVVVDLSDYTSILSMPDKQTSSFKIGSLTDDELSDDEFESLTTHRSFYIDAICGEEESPIENERDLQEWAEREARNLGLIGK
ncbi:hypothetical protein Q1695_013195 [Nippostrongylus brasiliensis]|nr:hypothetical protein Q1695_013195 [Nippostrongylus brasiliensis]